nr:excisionase [Collimonas pratensis]
MNTARNVTIALAATKTGLSEKAIRRKIESGVWIEGREWTRAIDGGIYIDMEGYDRWVGKAVASKSAKIVSG